MDIRVIVRIASIIDYIYIVLFSALKGFYMEGGNLLNHHQLLNLSHNLLIKSVRVITESLSDTLTELPVITFSLMMSVLK